MFAYRSFWVLITLEIILGGSGALYESEYQPHSQGYNHLVFPVIVLLVAIVQIAQKWCETSHNKGRLSGSDFRDDYIRLLTDAIEAVQDVKEYNEEQVRQAQKKILKLISSVVILFHPEAEGLGINANLMEKEASEKHSTNDRFDAHVYFTDPQRAASSYTGVLCVKVWADPPQVVPPDFSLPLDKDKDRILFGAPRTYAIGSEVVIRNIHRDNAVNSLLDGQPPVVKRAVHAFFKEQQYQTFISIPVKHSDTIIAVLNIQANRDQVFGRRTKHAAEMKKFVDPFCTVLGILTAQTLQPHPTPGS